LVSVGVVSRQQKKEVVKRFCEEFLFYNYKVHGYQKCCDQIMLARQEFKDFVTDYKKGFFDYKFDLNEFVKTKA
jgi:hypothetical protein